MNPKASFIIATNVYTEQLVAAVESCTAQTFPDFELILVANGVNDEKFDLISKLGQSDDRIVILRTDMRGLPYSLNYAIHLANSPLLVRMDADDICNDTRLKEQFEYLARHPEICLLGSACDLIDESDKIIGEWRYPLSHLEIVKSLRHNNPICHPAVAVRRQAMLDIGGYPNVPAEDYAAWIRLHLKSSSKFENLPDKLIRYRATSENHPRIDRWRSEKASLAGVQLSALLQSGDLRWGYGVAKNVVKVVGAPLWI